MIKIKRLFFKILRKTPLDMDMVRYWKTRESVQAKITKKDGVNIMKMEGEKYYFPGFPRGHILYGPLSKLKHEVKNQIFNDAWSLLEAGKSNKEVVDMICQKALPNIFPILEAQKYDIAPRRAMVPPVREIHRAWEKVSPRSVELREMVCYILQEDDAYRFRLQWIVTYMPTWAFRFINPIKAFDKALIWLERGEAIDDMKERIRLFRRVMGVILSDPIFAAKLKQLFREINWRKVKLSKADKYFFRGKYFKVDLDKFEY